MMWNKWKKFSQKVFSLFVFFLMASIVSAAEEPNVLDRFDETDINCILRSTKKLDIYPSGSFFVFIGLDANNRLRCEPLSGTRKVFSMNPSCLLKTGYWRETPYYELCMDAFKIFAASTFWRSQNPAPMQESFEWRCDLARVLGKQAVFVPMQQLVTYEKQCLSDFLRAFKRLDALKKEQRRNPDVFDEEDIEDLARELIKKTDSKLTSAMSLINDALNKNDILLAAAMYFNLRNFWMSTLSVRQYLVYQKNNFMKQLSINFLQAMDKICDDICAGISSRMQNQLHKGDFLALYPNARGLWCEAPPVDHGQLKEFFAQFYRIRSEMNTYSRSTEFEKWGNCCLSVMLCTQGTADANYIDQQFREALKKHKQLFAGGKKN